MTKMMPLKDLLNKTICWTEFKEMYSFNISNDTI